jgi:hypothetical protein
MKQEPQAKNRQMEGLAVTRPFSEKLAFDGVATDSRRPP